MTWLPLESAMLASVAYDATQLTLYLRFRNSGDVYRYFEVPSTQYQALRDAESHGAFFLTHIRNCFRYERLTKPHAA
jgi:hypothetical protein